MTKNKHHVGVFGLGWGDEGKGKIIDLLCPKFDVCVRFNGGANAGHTVWVGGRKFALHLLPTGVLHSRMVAVMGPGMVVDPIGLMKEIDALAKEGVDVSGRLRLSDRAHMVLAYHKIEDRLSEKSAGSGVRIGTTSQGIGPCYADKARRTRAVRFADLLDADRFTDRVRGIIDERQTMLRAVYGDDGGLNADAVLTELSAAAKRLRPLVCDTTSMLHEAIGRGDRLLFEGANGLLLDVDHGTYPFVTSSSTGPYSIGVGAGVPVSQVGAIIGALKAYSTRVGEGPFVTELRDEIGDRIRIQGNEFGTTTGRPRRCGWFDAVAFRYSVEVCGATDIALLHLDTLSGLDRVGVCVAYDCHGKKLSRPPADAAMLTQCEPVIEFLPGWADNLREARRFEDLPQTARNYVLRVEELLGARISLIGVGPDRSQVLFRHDLPGSFDRER